MHITQRFRILDPAHMCCNGQLRLFSLLAVVFSARLGRRVVASRRVGTLLTKAADPARLLAERRFRAFYIYWMETSLRHQRATGQKKTIEVYDLKGLSFSQLYMPGLRMLARTLKIGQSYYMESLHRCVVINTPRVFKMAWSLISSVLNERTRAKTLFFSDDGADFLQELMGYSRERVQALLTEANQTIHGGTLSDQAGHQWLKDEPQRPVAGVQAASPTIAIPPIAAHQWSRSWEQAQTPTRTPTQTQSESIVECDAAAVRLRECSVSAPSRRSSIACAEVRVVTD